MHTFGRSRSLRGGPREVSITNHARVGMDLAAAKRSRPRANFLVSRLSPSKALFAYTAATQKSQAETAFALLDSK